MKVIFTPLAARNLDELHSYITARAGEGREDGYVGRIVAFCNGFVTIPLRGRQRDDILPGSRVTAFERRTTIAFVVSDDTVLIEGVFYGGQDFEATLRNRPTA